MIHFHIYFFTLSAVKQLSGWNILNGLYELERFTSLQTKKNPANFGCIYKTLHECKNSIQEHYIDRSVCISATYIYAIVVRYEVLAKFVNISRQSNKFSIYKGKIQYKLKKHAH